MLLDAGDAAPERRTGVAFGRDELGAEARRFGVVARWERADVDVDEEGGREMGSEAFKRDTVGEEDALETLESGELDESEFAALCKKFFLDGVEGVTAIGIIGFRTARFGRGLIGRTTSTKSSSLSLLSSPENFALMPFVTFSIPSIFSSSQSLGRLRDASLIGPAKSVLEALGLYLGKEDGCGDGLAWSAFERPRSVRDARGLEGFSVLDLTSGFALDAEDGGGGGPIVPLSVAFEADDSAAFFKTFGPIGVVDIFGLSLTLDLLSIFSNDVLAALGASRTLDPVALVALADDDGASESVVDDLSLFMTSARALPIDRVIVID